MALHVAEVMLEIPKGTPPTHHWFASVDGQSFLEVSREPSADDEPAIAEMFQPRETSKGGYMSAMTMARRFLENWGATFSEVSA